MFPVDHNLCIQAVLETVPNCCLMLKKKHIQPLTKNKIPIYSWESHSQYLVLSNDNYFPFYVIYVLFDSMFVVPNRFKKR